MMDPIVSHFKIFACASLYKLDVIVKAYLLQLYILEMFVNPFTKNGRLEYQELTKKVFSKTCKNQELFER